MNNSKDLIQPPASASQNAHIQNFEDYEAMYQESIENPLVFWAKIATEFHWISRWQEVCGFNYDRIANFRGDF